MFFFKYWFARLSVFTNLIVLLFLEDFFVEEDFLVVFLATFFAEVVDFFLVVDAVLDLVVVFDFVTLVVEVVFAFFEVSFSLDSAISDFLTADCFAVFLGSFSYFNFTPIIPVIFFFG